MDINKTGSVGSRINRDPLDELLGYRLQVDRPVDPTKRPVIRQPLRVLDARIR